MSTWMEKRYDGPTKVRLLGDYWAILSCEEVNEWTDYLWGNLEYTKYNETNFALKAIHVAYSGSLNESEVFEKIREVEEEQHELVKKLNAIAKKWYEDVIVSKDKDDDND